MTINHAGCHSHSLPRHLPLWAVVCAIIISAMTLMAPASAAIITFADKTLFLSQTSATDATGAMPASGGPYDGLSVGSVSFYAERFFVDNYTTYLSGNEIGVSWGAGEFSSPYTDGLDATFDSLVYSAGFDFVEPSVGGGGLDACGNATCVDSTYQVTLINGATIIDSFMFNAADDTAAFIGVWSDALFDKLEIREIVGDDDNELYGQFYTGDTVLSPVPLPAGVWLFVSGIIGLIGLARHKKLS